MWRSFVWNLQRVRWLQVNYLLFNSIDIVFSASMLHKIN
jgi:hypothetical protein